MTRIVVLGGGQQGRIIATDLARRHQVTVLDIRKLDIPGVTCVQADLTNTPALMAHLVGHELAVGALPGGLGYEAAKAAIEAKRSFVDVAFFPEDAASLDRAAQRAKVAIVPDCGVAPGLSNLIVGRALATGQRQRISIEVGGVAAERGRPLGYVVTWSPADLEDEFKRPARVIRMGKVVSLKAASELEIVDIPGVGKMESFLTDGLRTLLDVKGISDMTEKTLRWPGHVATVLPLIKNGTFIKTLRNKCLGGLDLVVFRIRVDNTTVLMTERGRPEISAMARTTALTTAAVANWVASGALTETGVIPPERIGGDPKAYRAILESLQAHGIKLDPAFPFLD